MLGEDGTTEIALRWMANRRDVRGLAEYGDAQLRHASQNGLRSGESCCPELQSGQGSHEDEDNRSPYGDARSSKRGDMGLGQGELGSLDAFRAGVPDPTPKPMSPRFKQHKRATPSKSITAAEIGQG
jgi:hypothetical protein